MEEIRNYDIDQFASLLDKELESIEDLQLLILKGHIVTEFSINCYLEKISKNENDNFFKENYSYKLKLKLLSSFGEGLRSDPDMIKVLDLLNKVRNSIAHSLNINQQLLDELVTSIRNYILSESDRKEYQTQRDVISHAIGFLGAFYFLGSK